jgi:pimeloyl-ACP methyl ester carboxylesterase
MRHTHHVELEERSCNVGGRAVRYHTVGTGPPALLVHGLAGSWRWWRPVAEPLASRHRLYLVDLPGFGSARGQQFVLRDTPTFLRALIEQLGLERPHLVGHSLGGAICARAAALWPDSIGRLVLAAPACVLERRRLENYALPLLAAARQLRPSFLHTVATDSLRAGVVTLYRAATQILADDALRDELAAIVVPTLLLWGDRDPLIPLRLAQQYELALAQSRLVVLAGAGHVPMNDRPAQFAQAVLEFLAGPAR